MLGGTDSLRCALRGPAARQKAMRIRQREGRAREEGTRMSGTAGGTFEQRREPFSFWLWDGRRRCACFARRTTKGREGITPPTRCVFCGRCDAWLLQTASSSSAPTSCIGERRLFARTERAPRPSVAILHAWDGVRDCRMKDCSGATHKLIDTCSLVCLLPQRLTSSLPALSHGR
jgi:hypothetical protein